jgi:hypothetical protein
VGSVCYEGAGSKEALSVQVKDSGQQALVENKMKLSEGERI